MDSESRVPHSRDWKVDSGLPIPHPRVCSGLRAANRRCRRGCPSIWKCRWGFAIFHGIGLSENAMARTTSSARTPGGILCGQTPDASAPHGLTPTKAATGPSQGITAPEGVQAALVYRARRQPSSGPLEDHGLATEKVGQESTGGRNIPQRHHSYSMLSPSI